MASPVRVAYALRPLPAWRAIEIIVGVFFEGFAEGRDTEEIVEWMTTQTTISRYKWMIEGSDLFILPRGRGFDAEMIAELESLAASLERKELALFAVYIEIRVPYGTH